MLGCASGVVWEDSMGQGIETAWHTILVHRRQTAQTGKGACEDVTFVQSCFVGRHLNSW